MTMRVAAAEAPAGFRALFTQCRRLVWSGGTELALRLLEGARNAQFSPRQQYELGTLALCASRGRSGWDLYDAHPSLPQDMLAGVPRWDGSRTARLVIVAEQGFGDAIQFLRFVPQVSDRATSLILAIHDELHDIVKASRLLKGVAVVRKADALQTTWPAGTHWERMMSLPLRLHRPQLITTSAYLCAPHSENRLAALEHDNRVIVGLAWRSTPRKRLPDRSYPAELTRYVSALPHVRAVSLHPREEAGVLPNVLDLDVRTFGDTLRVIEACDAVVTCDTVTAHLAAAAGRPTFICLRHRPDWRWGTPTRPTRWYGSARLRFQPRAGDWDSVLRSVAHEVSCLMPTLHSRRQAERVRARPDQLRSSAPTF